MSQERSNAPRGQRMTGQEIAETTRPDVKVVHPTKHPDQRGSWTAIARMMPFMIPHLFQRRGHLGKIENLHGFTWADAFARRLFEKGPDCPTCGFMTCGIRLPVSGPPAATAFTSTASCLATDNP